MQVRAVSVIDAVENGPAFSASYVGLFAPDSDEFHLDGLGPAQWWSALSATEEHMYARQSLGGRRLYCRQGDGANLPTAVPINIWSMQCLLCERPGEMPFTAAWARDASGHVDLRVTNHSDAPIRRGQIRVSADSGLRTCMKTLRLADRGVHGRSDIPDGPHGRAMGLDRAAHPANQVRHPQRRPAAGRPADDRQRADVLCPCRLSMADAAARVRPVAHGAWWSARCD